MCPKPQRDLALKHKSPTHKPNIRHIMLSREYDTVSKEFVMFASAIQVLLSKCAPSKSQFKSIDTCKSTRKYIQGGFLYSKLIQIQKYREQLSMSRKKFHQTTYKYQISSLYTNHQEKSTWLSTRRGRYLEIMFCKQFSETSPCLHGQQGSCENN